MGPSPAPHPHCHTSVQTPPCQIPDHPDPRRVPTTAPRPRETGSPRLPHALSRTAAPGSTVVAPAGGTSPPPLSRPGGRPPDQRARSAPPPPPASAGKTPDTPHAPMPAARAPQNACTATPRTTAASGPPDTTSPRRSSLPASRDPTPGDDTEAFPPNDPAADRAPHTGSFLAPGLCRNGDAVDDSAPSVASAHPPSPAAALPPPAASPAATPPAPASTIPPNAHSCAECRAAQSPH